MMDLFLHALQRSAATFADGFVSACVMKECGYICPFCVLGSSLSFSMIVKTFKTYKQQVRVEFLSNRMC